jgi:hypothetical protein
LRVGGAVHLAPAVKGAVEALGGFGNHPFYPFGRPPAGSAQMLLVRPQHLQHGLPQLRLALGRELNLAARVGVEGQIGAFDVQRLADG